MHFARLRPDDLLAIEEQASQHLTLGLRVAYSAEERATLAQQPVAWSACCAGRLVACYGIMETFPGTQGTAWAVLAEGIGAAHLAVTRFAQRQIAMSALARIEALVRAHDIEPLVRRFPNLTPAQLTEVAMADPTPEMRWAARMGLTAVHVLRKFGADAATAVLFERIVPSLVTSTNVRPRTMSEASMPGGSV